MADDIHQIQDPKSQDPHSVLGGLNHRGGGVNRGVERVESRPALGGERPMDTVEITEVGSPELEKKPELAGYIEDVEKAAEDAPLVVDDYTGQILLNPVSQKPNVITLPLTQAQVQDGLHHQVWESVRWLAEWCVRQVKVLNEKVQYKT